MLVVAVLAAVNFAGLRVASLVTADRMITAARVRPTVAAAAISIVSGMIIGATVKGLTNGGPEFSDRQPSRACRRVSRSPADLAGDLSDPHSVPAVRVVPLVRAVKAVRLIVLLAKAGPIVPAARAVRFAVVAKADRRANGAGIRRDRVAGRRENLVAANRHSARNQRVARSRNSSSGTGVRARALLLRLHT